MIATFAQHSGNHLFLANAAVADVLDRDPGFCRQLLRPLAQPVAQRLGKRRKFEDRHLAAVQVPCHSLRIADVRQSAGHHHPVVARQHTSDLRLVAVHQCLAHRVPPRRSGRWRLYSLLGSGSAGSG